MRLWTVHPSYLDAKGLVAAWREALLAKKVLAGRTRGYRHHPQLVRFQAHPRPRAAIAIFLRSLEQEAKKRGYRFDARKVGRLSRVPRIEETEGQLGYEWRHLRTKLRARAPQLYCQFRAIRRPETHPLFRLVPGPVRDWEKRQPKGAA
ncbi:MAG TPA: pyrimidine dimer DNA glycosylase/endonuclease V [Opitutaceae bacterium]|nr:pyrimidine dimer DNA glycosylase/endonuclease V [Opitutaceae bacterium]